VELENVKINTEVAAGKEIIRIKAADINDPDFTQDLIIWNNGDDTLGGINTDTPEIKAGDKTVISVCAAG
jgi:hypothetical protein